MLLSLVNPSTVYSRMEDYPLYSSNIEPISAEWGAANLDVLGEDTSNSIYFPLVSSQNPPPRENITLSIFSMSGASLGIFERNLDSNGIPLLVEGFTNGNGYHPSYICRYALYVAAAYDLNPNEENYQKIQNLMTWIVDNKVVREKFITWEFFQDLPSFNLTAPWTSALTNAWCSGALLHGYRIIGDSKLEAHARASLEYLFTPLSEGGGLFQFDNGDIWFEESPNLETPSHILNGFIYAIEVLDMFTSYFGYNRYQDFFDRAISSLVNRIDQYDVGYGSIYDLYTRGNKLGMGYHYLHCVQLYYLYLRTGNPRLLEYSQKWYGLTYQYKYDLRDSSASIDNIRYINDGIYWYNYVIVGLPMELTFNFEKIYEIQTINLFMYRDYYPTEQMSIFYRAEDGNYLLKPPTDYTTELAGSNNTNGHITNVYTLVFNESVDTDSLRIIMEKTTSNDISIFREIGILKNMNEEYQVEMQNTKYEDIVNLRMKN